jgi:hypothetical protein
VDVAPLTAPPALVTVVPALESTTRRPISGPAPTPLARPALMPAPAGRPPSRLAGRALAALLALAAACDRSGAGPIAGEGGGDVGGTVVIATAAEPATLFPPLAAGSPAAAVVDQVFDRLAEVGDSLGTFGDGGFRPRLASRWAWAPDSLAVTFTLAPGARWHDGRPVTSRDVAFSFAVATDPDVASPSSAFLANVDSISTPDSVTAVAWFKRRLPTQFFDLTYYMYVLPEHLLGRVPRAQLARSPFARRPVGSGRFRLEEWTRGERLVLAADAENYRGRPRLDRAVWSVAPDFGAATIRFLSGEADFFENLRAESVGQLERGEALRALPTRRSTTASCSSTCGRPTGRAGRTACSPTASCAARSPWRSTASASCATPSTRSPPWRWARCRAPSRRGGRRCGSSRTTRRARAPCSTRSAGPPAPPARGRAPACRSPSP